MISMLSTIQEACLNVEYNIGTCATMHDESLKYILGRMEKEKEGLPETWKIQKKLEPVYIQWS